VFRFKLSAWEGFHPFVCFFLILVHGKAFILCSVKYFDAWETLSLLTSTLFVSYSRVDTLSILVYDHLIFFMFLIIIGLVRSPSYFGCDMVCSS